MNKEALIAAGLTEEQAKKVMELHKAELNGNYIPKVRFDEVNEQLKTTKQELSNRDEQIAGLKKFEGSSKELSEKVKALEAENKEKAKQFEAQLKETKLKNAVRASLGDSVFDPSLVMGLVDLSKVELNDNDEVKSGLKEQVETLKKEKAFLFKTDTTPKPNIKIKGQEPADGKDDAHADDVGVALAKRLAAGNRVAPESVAQKASNIYFGENK